MLLCFSESPRLGRRDVRRSTLAARAEAPTASSWRGARPGYVGPFLGVRSAQPQDWRGRGAPLRFRAAPLRRWGRCPEGALPVPPPCAVCLTAICIPLQLEDFVCQPPDRVTGTEPWHLRAVDCTL